MSDAKKPGHCSLCDKAVYDIRQTWPHGHVLGGYPRRIGAPGDDAHRGTFELADGSTMDLTLCGACAEAAGEPENLVALWRRVLAAFRFEEVHREVLGVRPRTAAQRETAEAELMRMRDRVPLAMAGAEPMKQESQDG